MLVPQRAAHPLGGSSSSLGAPGRGHTDHRAGDVAAGARSSQAPEAAQPAGPRQRLLPGPRVLRQPPSPSQSRKLSQAQRGRLLTGTRLTPQDAEC